MVIGCEALLHELEYETDAEELRILHRKNKHITDKLCARLTSEANDCDLTEFDLLTGVKFSLEECIAKSDQVKATKTAEEELEETGGTAKEVHSPPDPNSEEETLRDPQRSNTEAETRGIWTKMCCL